MRIILHAGTVTTDEGRLIATLRRDAEAHAARGVALPPPDRYRTLLRDTLVSMRRADPAPDAREVLLDAMLDRPETEVARLVLSNDRFFAAPQQAFAGGALFPQAEERLANLRRLFPEDPIELRLAIRDPATFLPAVMAVRKSASLEDVMEGLAPQDMQWSELIARLRDSVPEVPITVWCDEDSPVLWGALLRDLAGAEADADVPGAFELLQEIMSEEGLSRMRAYLAAHPELTEPLKRRAMLAFLDKYAVAEMMEEELDVPGWTDETVAELTAAYDADVARIGRMEGVTLLSV